MPDWLTRIEARFGSDGIRRSEFRDNLRLDVSPDQLLDLLKALQQDFGFDYLADVAGIDYLQFPNATDRYGVVYCLVNTTTAERVFVRTFVNDPTPALPSVVSLWQGADWLEREVFDMFGIEFTAHPDLRRILMPEGFVSFPLRKDYPLRGCGERHNFEPTIRAQS